MSDITESERRGEDQFKIGYLKAALEDILKSPEEAVKIATSALAEYEESARETTERIRARARAAMRG